MEFDVNLAGRMEEITKAFVAVKSVNGTAGEKAAADFVEGWLRRIPYFAAHPKQVIRQEIKGDKLQRSNIFAWVHGKKRESTDTILLHGHMDTVGTEDYGKLEAYAVDCDKLLAKLLQLDLPSGLREELASGDWLPGRGACDMKSGDVVFMVLLEYLSQHLEWFSGNLLLSINPVEENQHTGMLAGLSLLVKLQQEQGFHYLFAINNDYICPLYEGDTHRYIYTGVVGKLLPCFYIRGHETHVGQCFEGVDASVAMAEIVRALNYNTDYCDGYQGEFTLPPSVLKLKDLKNSYNVQTAQEAFAYFNYMVHSKSAVQILAEMKAVAQKALDTVTTRIQAGAAAYAELSGQAALSAGCRPVRVLTAEELTALIKENEADIEETLQARAAELQEDGMDLRMISLELVRLLVRKADFLGPVAVVFFAPPYCPFNTLRQENEGERRLYEQLAGIVNDFGQETGETYEIKQFFPSLSDSSYLTIQDDETSVACLQKNMPAMAKLYPLPLESIRALHIPALNYGCYGKDAHKWTERVYKPYSFQVLPRLLLKTFAEFLG